MDPTALAELLQSFAIMAKSNQDLAAAVQANAAVRVNEEATPTVPTNNGAGASNDVMANVALTNIKVPLDMGDSAEERLVNFHEWKEEVNDKLKVACVRDKILQTTIALMWGGKDIKSFAIEKADVKVEDDDTGTEPVHADTWEEAITKIEKVMEDGINESFAMFKFRQNEQGQRNINSWHKHLKSSVKTLRLGRCSCGLGYSEDRAIRDVMIELTNDSKLRKDGLTKDLSLQEILKEGEANELARARSATVEGKTVHKVDMTDKTLTDDEADIMIAKLKRAGRYSTKSDKDKVSHKTNLSCDRCTNSRKAHSSDNCYFRNLECFVCKKIGHMGGSRRCKGGGKEVNQITRENKDFEDKSNWHHEKSGETLHATSTHRQEISIKKVAKKNVVRVKVGGVETEMFADSGAEVSIVPSHWYVKGMGKLQATNDILKGYGASQPLPVTAKFRTSISTKKGATTESWVYIVDGGQEIQPLLGDADATALGFLAFQPDGRDPTLQEKEVKVISRKVKIGEGAMPDVRRQPDITERERRECIDVTNDPKYKSIFDGHIGTMKNRKPIIFHADEERQIVSQPYRPIPPQFHEELSNHLQFLRANGKIVDVDPNREKIETSSNLVITRKSTGKIRMNLDARPVNATMALIVPPHMTTPEEVRHRLSGSTRFSEFDMNHGYNQGTLSDETSRKYGVFQSHEGFHRFTALYFGHSQASQAFNEDVKTSLRGLAATECVADNILVHTKKAGNHKADLIKFLDRCLEEGITLAKDKMKVCEDEVLWFGYVFGKKGVRPDPAKVQKLKEKGAPETQEDVRSFLQAAQFNAKFMWNTNGAYSNTTQPLRQLLGKGIPFVWGSEQRSSYDDIIRALDSAGALYPYNPDLEICHVADAQPSGIASSLYMITRDENNEETWWPLNHVSRSLTKTEMGYPQIDRESLAQAWGMRQHRFYLLGRSFTTFSDHKPLLSFYNGKKRPTPRVEKHILSVQDLAYNMQFMKGKDNPTDWNSRHPENADGWTEQQRIKHDVDEGEEIRLNRISAVRKLDQILHDSGITNEKRCCEEDIAEIGSQDESYSTARKLIASGRSDKVKGEYKQVAGELSADNKVMLKGGKLVIPKGKDGSLRQNILNAAHEGHPGMSGVKSRLRDSAYWPGITKDVEEELRYCLSCQATGEGRHHKDKLTPSQPPERVWSKVGADHWGPLPDGGGRHILVMQDYLTKYPEAIVVKNTAVKDNIRAMEEIFGRHGYPRKLITDNGPPWNGFETHAMKQYLSWAGVEHNPTHSAEDPEANGLAERLMQLVGKAWETAHIEGRDPLNSLNTALKTYRNTTHTVTGRKPAEWLFGRTIRTRLPDYKQLQTQHDDEKTSKAKEKMRERGKLDKARRDARAREEVLEVGMKVLLKNKRKKKGVPKYDPEPYTITELVGRQAVLNRSNKTVRRETQKFKRFYCKEDITGTDDDWWEDVRITTQNPQTENKETETTTSTDTLTATTTNNTTETTAHPTAEHQTTALTDTTEQAISLANPPRRSNRDRKERDMYGSWDTSTRTARK